MKNVFYLLTFLLIFGCQSKEKETLKKPNIVFVFADDFTYSAINALGNNEVQTSNLNRLVNQGTTFTHTYNMGAWNGAVCAASRAMIISGRSVWAANSYRQLWKQGNGMDKSWKTHGGCWL